MPLWLLPFCRRRYGHGGFDRRRIGGQRESCATCASAYFSSTESPIAALAEPGCSSRSSGLLHDALHSIWGCVHDSKIVVLTSIGANASLGSRETTKSSFPLACSNADNAPSLVAFVQRRERSASGRAQNWASASKLARFCSFLACFQFPIELGVQPTGLLRALRLCLLASCGVTRRCGARSFYGGSSVPVFGPVSIPKRT